MDETLPDEFDVIVIGTGLPESVLSGALSRINKRVLHIDSNDYYGSDWASFNIKAFDELMKDNEDSNQQLDIDVEKLISEGEEFFEITPRRSVLHGQSHCHLNHAAVKEPLQECTSETAQESGDAKSEAQPPPGESREETTEPIETCDVDEQQASGSFVEANVLESVEAAATDEQPSSTDSTEVEATCAIDDPGESPRVKSEVEDTKKSTPRFPTYEEFYEQWRRFNIDLASKIMFSRGKLVELLIQSNVSRYLEFRNVTRTLTLLVGEDNLQPVPCSRADVFKSKFVTIIEKRILMRVLTLCANYEQHTQEYEDFRDKPFIEFLQSKKLSKKAQHFIVHSIAMINEDTLTLDGLGATQKFLQSLGRYGNTAFLFPMYGIGELPQAFSRLSAVFGGTFCLRRHAIGIIVDAQTRICKAIIDSTGQKIRCQHLVLGESHVPNLFRKDFTSQVSRAVYITDKSVVPSDTEQVSLITLPPTEVRPWVRLIETGPLCCVCPSKLYLIHALSSSQSTEEGTNANLKVEDIFHSVEKTIFAGNATEIDNRSRNTTEKCYTSADDNTEVGSSTKPTVLWSAYFTLMGGGVLRGDLPTNVHVMNGPGCDLGFDNAMSEAQAVFQSICPDEDFLPRAPEPDEIVFDDEGYNTENNGTPAEAEQVAGDYVEEQDDDLQEEVVEGHSDEARVEENRSSEAVVGGT